MRTDDAAGPGPHAQHARGRRETGGPEEFPNIGARLGLREDLGAKDVDQNGPDEPAEQGRHGADDEAGALAPRQADPAGHAVLALSAVGAATLRRYGAIDYGQKWHLRPALWRKRLSSQGDTSHHQQRTAQAPSAALW